MIMSDLGSLLRESWLQHRVGPGAAFDESGHSEVWSGVPKESEGYKISFSLEAWFSCDKQNECLEGLLFSLACIGIEAKAGFKHTS